jgi:hypothetical protein
MSYKIPFSDPDSPDYDPEFDPNSPEFDPDLVATYEEIERKYEGTDWQDVGPEDFCPCGSPDQSWCESRESCKGCESAWKKAHNYFVSP